jgi:hypothetical protein
MVLTWQRQRLRHSARVPLDGLSWLSLGNDNISDQPIIPFLAAINTNLTTGRSRVVRSTSFMPPKTHLLVVGGGHAACVAAWAAAERVEIAQSYAKNSSLHLTLLFALHMFLFAWCRASVPIASLLLFNYIISLAAIQLHH